MILDEIINKQSDPNQVLDFREFEEKVEQYFKYWRNKKDKIFPMENLPFKGDSKSMDKILERKPFSYLNGFIEPIVANMFIDNYKAWGLTVREASEILGLSWNNGDKSTLAEKQKLYPHIKRYFENLE